MNPSTPAQGKQFTSVVIDEWTPATRIIRRPRRPAVKKDMVKRAPATSRKAAKRAMFWLEKNHWPDASVGELEQWLRNDMNMYLSSGYNWIKCSFANHETWCEFDMYLARLARYIEKRKEAGHVENGR